MAIAEAMPTNKGSIVRMGIIIITGKPMLAKTPTSKENKYHSIYLLNGEACFWIKGKTRKKM
jgi:hypothetical protein